jgi:hypothetical protein
MVVSLGGCDGFSNPHLAEYPPVSGENSTVLHPVHQNRQICKGLGIPIVL